MAVDRFHPAVRRWFRDSFAAPTEAQARAWPAVAEGRDALISAPTGSGKTLAAFLAAIDDLVRQGLEGRLRAETQVVYVSPLKALSNDVQRNLQAPLAGIGETLAAQGCPPPEIRTLVRTGDTPQTERAAMRKRPPHIVVTTPESLHILLTSEGGRRMLSTTRTVIIDEIHALAGTKRGAHLALSLERLGALTPRRPTRIGLSATQRPIEEIARFLAGAGACDASGEPDCAVVDTGHVRARDLALELAPAPLEAVMSGEVWELVYDRLAELIDGHRTTLVFANTRRTAERVARHLSERLGEDAVTAHHGSLSREHRLDAERRLRDGGLRALVATASLELGIDVGDVDLVCQLGSPRSIATFLQRAGRSGHSLGGLPKGRLFPLSRDDLIECTAILDAARRGELDRLVVPDAPLDVLAQQAVAEVAAAGEYAEEALFDLLRRAWPYRGLAREDFDAVVRMEADGIATGRGRRGAHLHRDAVHRRLRPRRGARLAAITSGGTIPDQADYEVILEPTGGFIGTLNEDFAIESLAGDIFQLGNAAYRIIRIETGRVRVEDARGQPPNIPFWFGEAPGRTDELSAAVSRLRAALAERLERDGADGARGWLVDEIAIPDAAAQQITDYLAAAYAALGTLPTHGGVALERFFDESGGMQLVVHAPFGSRINRAWGLALRKRFCRSFNFELQAAATEDAIVLSLTEAHSFALEEVARYLHPSTVREVLTQAVLDAPMFGARWRWCATTALALLRMRGGKKVAPQLQRMQAEDLLAAVFPDQAACLENLTGDREVPDHPLVRQTLHDCLCEAMDVEGLERVLAAVHEGDVTIVARDLTEPSPLAAEILNARPYAFLDDTPLEERRTQAVLSRRWLDPESAADLGRLDGEAIERVRAEAWPDAEHPDEMHDALLVLGCVTDTEVAQARWAGLLQTLVQARRATRLPAAGRRPELWVAVERLPQMRAVHPSREPAPPHDAPAEAEREWSRREALIELVRGRLGGLGPVTVARLARELGVAEPELEPALAALQGEGFAMQGRFTPGASQAEWCDRRLLARIHRYTVNRLRREIEPVSRADFMRFLSAWQRATPDTRGEGPQALAAIVEQLEGFEAAAAAWEADILPARMTEYDPAWLDNLCLSGRAVWARRTPPRGTEGRGAGPLRTTPIALMHRRTVGAWRTPAPPGGGTAAEKVAEHLRTRGASFFEDIVEGSGLLRTQTEGAIGELVARGRVTSDGFQGLRALLVPEDKRRGRRGRAAVTDLDEAGRWALLPEPDDRADVELIARTLLRRYGMVFRRLLEREASLPPWRELVWALRRLEARGEVRGGRFVAGFTGEQYALPEAVGTLREVRRQAPRGTLISVSGADPLNLVGVVTPGPRVPGQVHNRLLLRDGVPVAVRVAGEVRYLESPDPSEEWAWRTALVRRAVPPALRRYLS